jgi:hypothetical protein
MDRMSIRKAAADRRTLPPHVAPVSGEALDSWLEALAYRHLIPFVMLLRRCSIHHQVLRDDWMWIPDRRQFEHVEHITGVETSTLIKLTLARYEGLGPCEAIDVDDGGGGGGGAQAAPLPTSLVPRAREGTPVPPLRN